MIIKSIRKDKKPGVPNSCSQCACARMVNISKKKVKCVLNGCGIPSDFYWGQKVLWCPLDKNDEYDLVDIINNAKSVWLKDTP